MYLCVVVVVVFFQSRLHIIRVGLMFNGRDRHMIVLIFDAEIRCSGSSLPSIWMIPSTVQ